MNIFISYNSQNSSFVLQIVEKLKIFNGAISIQKKLFFDQDNLEAGQNWVKEIQEALDISNVCIVFIGEQGIGNWQNKEVLTAMNRYDATRGEFKIIPVIIPHGKRDQIQKNIPWFLADIQWIEFVHDTDPDAFQKLTGAIFNAAIEYDPINPDKCPYKGLDFFDVEDAAIFFGRTFDTNWIFYKKLQLQSKASNRFLAIVGDSGSGKSSVARAGILANIKAGRFPGSNNWIQIIFSPEDNPLLKLSAALQSSGIITDAKKMEEDAKTDISTLRRNLEIYGSRIVLLADQFEELITQCKDNSLREAFLKNLIEALKSQFIVCIITMRSDFYAAFSPFREFADLLETNNYTITSLDFNTAGVEWERYLRAIIQKPAQLLNVHFEPTLTKQIVEDCKQLNGILPALQLALVGLWKKRTDPVKIGSADYDSLASGKGIGGIIEAHANNTWNVLTGGGSDKHSENLIKAIFIRLVEITSNKEDVRKTVSKTELMNELRSQFKQHEAAEMLNTLSGPDARLIRIKNDEVNKNISWVEVIHEVLIRQWDMLRKWINERRVAIQYRNKLEQYIDDNNKLFTGKKQAEAEQWVRDNKDLATDKINNFVEKGHLHARKKKRTLVIGLIAVVVLTIIASILYPVIQCRNCTLVNEVLKYGNFKDDEIHTLTISGTSDINYLHCFKNLDTLILQAKTGEDYLSQENVNLLPQGLKKLSIYNFFTNDTILTFRSLPNLKVLDISTLKGLRKLNISNLDSLTELSLSGLENYNSLEGINNVNTLQILTLSNLGNVSALSGIQKLENLKALHLSGLDHLSGLAGIRDLKNLHTLSLSNLRVTEFDEIGNLKTLRNLTLSELSITSLDDIKNLNSIQRLSLLSLPNVPDLQGIENLKTLQTLALDLHVDSLTAIEHLGNLQDVSLSGVRIQSLASLKNLKKLQTLSLSNLPNISSITEIENLKNLHHLAISDLNISSISVIKTLEKLQTLQLSGLRTLSTLDGVETLNRLHTLALSELPIDNLSPIQNLHQLRTLSLKDVAIPTLSGIENLESLQTLTLSELNLPDLSGIENLKNLETLNLSYLPEVELSTLADLNNLHTLSLSYLPNKNLSGIEHLTNIRLLYLDNIGKSGMVAIPVLKNLGNVDSMILFKVKLESLNFIDEKMKLKNFIYNNELELLNREKELLSTSNKMKQTKFFNLSILRGPSDDRLPTETTQ